MYNSLIDVPEVLPVGTSYFGIRLDFKLLIYVRNGSGGEHWATVTGRNNNSYTIIDPWVGKECDLSEMQKYKDAGGYAAGYATIS